MEIQEERLDSRSKKKALVKGLLLGAVLLVLSIFSFYFITTMTTSMWLIIGAPFIFSVIIPLVISIFFTLDLRKQIGGYWIFKQAVSAVFIMFFTAFIVESIGRDLIFAKFIEPDMVQKTEEAMINATTHMLEKNSMDQTQIDKRVDSLQKEFEGQSDITVGKKALGMGLTVILLFVLALIFGAMFKKERLRDGLEYAIDPTDTTA